MRHTETSVAHSIMKCWYMCRQKRNNVCFSFAPIASSVWFVLDFSLHFLLPLFLQINVKKSTAHSMHVDIFIHSCASIATAQLIQPPFSFLSWMFANEWEKSIKHTASVCHFNNKNTTTCGIATATIRMSEEKIHLKNMQLIAAKIARFYSLIRLFVHLTRWLNHYSKNGTHLKNIDYRVGVVRRAKYFHFHLPSTSSWLSCCYHFNWKWS